MPSLLRLESQKVGVRLKIGVFSYANVLKERPKVKPKVEVLRKLGVLRY